MTKLISDVFSPFFSENMTVAESPSDIVKISEEGFMSYSLSLCFARDELRPSNLLTSI